MAKTAKATPATKKRAPNGISPVDAAKPDKKKKDAVEVVTVAPVHEKLSDEPPEIAIAALTDAPPDAQKKAKKDKKDKKKKKKEAEALALASAPADAVASAETDKKKDKKDKKRPQPGEPLDKKAARKELVRLQVELVKLQEWVKAKGLKVVIIFEGRDAAGKGGAIKRITESLNPRVCKVVALGTPTEREKTQWYFQRYVPYLPAAGEIVLFDRSWYNRAGVERVMGFCTEPEYHEFLRSCPEFERMLLRAGIILVKYWFSVSPEEQARRFQARIDDVTKRWKLSPIDMQSRARWLEYSKAKDDMFSYTDTKQSPWWVIDSDNKEVAYLNMIAHLLKQVPYNEIEPVHYVLPPLQDNISYERPPMEYQSFVPKVYGV